MDMSGNRAEMLVRMRQTRMELLRTKMKEAGLQDRASESPKPTVKRGLAAIEKYDFQPEMPATRRKSTSKSPQIQTEERSQMGRRQAREQGSEYLGSYIPFGTHDEEVRRLSVQPSDSIPQVKFYDSAIDTYNRKALIECLVTEDIKNKANSKKINKKSEQILREKLEENLLSAILSVCPSEDSLVSFEKLGRILYLLGAFYFVKYDENCEVIIDLDPADKPEQIQKYEEMVFHEQLWGHLAYDGHRLQQGVGRDYVLLLLRTLFDQNLINAADHADMIAKILKQDGRFVVLTSTAVQDGDDIMTLWGLAQLVKKYHEMAKNKMYYNRIGYLKLDKAEELQKEITFTPKINDMSRILSQANEAKLRSNSNISQKDGPSARVSMLYHKNNLKEKRVEALRKYKEDESMRECTFQPNLSKTNSFNKRTCSQRGIRVSPDAVVNRLYETQKDKFDMLSQLRQDKQNQKELQELNKCTFFPKTNEIDRVEDLRQMYDQAELPRDYYKNIGRLRIANQRHVEKKHKLEHIPTGEGYDRVKSMPFNPPSCADVERQTIKPREPFMHFDVNIAPGRVGRLAICEGDDPSDKARSFAAAFQLKPEVEENLRNLIEANLEDHYRNKQDN